MQSSSNERPNIHSLQDIKDLMAMPFFPSFRVRENPMLREDDVILYPTSNIIVVKRFSYFWFSVYGVTEASTKEVCLFALNKIIGHINTHF